MIRNHNVFDAAHFWLEIWQGGGAQEWWLFDDGVSAGCSIFLDDTPSARILLPLSDSFLVQPSCRCVETCWLVWKWPVESQGWVWDPHSSAGLVDLGRLGIFLSGHAVHWQWGAKFILIRSYSGLCAISLFAIQWLSSLMKSAFCLGTAVYLHRRI